MSEEKKEKPTSQETNPPKKEPKLGTPRPSPIENPSVSHHDQKPGENLTPRPLNTEYPSNTVKAFINEDPASPNPPTERPEPTTDPSTSTKEDTPTKKEK